MTDCRLLDKVAVITGAASGIGEATARLFARHGCHVVLGDINEDRGWKLAREIGGLASFVHCDVTDPLAVKRLIDVAAGGFGKIDVLFNNAGVVGVGGCIEDISVSGWKETLDVLLNGVFYGMKFVAPVMKSQNFGSIITTASVAGISGGLGPTAYSTSKHAVIGLTKCMAAELGLYGIRVNAIAPFAMATPMVAEVYFSDSSKMDETKSVLEANSPLRGRAGSAEDVAYAALWLASDESGYTSGMTLTTDAGYTAGARGVATRFSVESPGGPPTL